jgi:hypothetical protein
MTCPRSIRFIIPGKSNIQITATENAGKIDFQVVVLAGGKADLNGLFFHFNETLLPGLTIVGDPLISGTQVGANSVIDLGNGTNMNGAASPFDIGLKFGGPGGGGINAVSGPVNFTLAGSSPLTLDAIAHMDFGAKLTGVAGKGNTPAASKVVVKAPAAPDAIDDVASTKEDVGVVINVLANDTDADGDALVITSVEGASHGTVSVSADGKSIIYTAVEDYSGSDTFTYCVSDGNGGQDSAEVTVTVIPVADPPDIMIEVLPPQAGDGVDMVRLRVTATQSDFDGSEFIDRLEVNGLPAGVILQAGSMVVNPAGQPDTLTQDFILKLPTDTDTNGNFTITAFSQEEGNGDPDEASATVSKKIEVNHTHNEVTEDFLVTDQSIWDTGGSFNFHDERFIGVEKSLAVTTGGIVRPEVSGNIKAGFETTIDFNGGKINATLPYDITLDSVYNKTSDILKISASAALSSAASFVTVGPSGAFDLDFLFNAEARAKLILDLGIVGSWTLLESDLPSINIDQDVLSFNSASAGGSVDIAAGFSVNYAWPNVGANGAVSGVNTVSGSGVSNNFIGANLDVDDLVSAILFGGVNPFDLGFDIGLAKGTLELLDLDLSGGLNFLQKFVLQAGDLTGQIRFDEDNSTQAFSFATGLQINNASSHDVDMDGSIDFTLLLTPGATLDNETDLGFNVGAAFKALTLSGSYDVGVDSGSFSFGPLINLSGNETIATVDVYDNTFNLAVNSGDVSFLA